MRKTLLLSAMLSLTACAGRQAIVTIPPARCADLVPATWKDGVEATPVPSNAPVTLNTPLTAALVAQIIAPWASAYVGMSGQLEKANGRTSDAIGIVTNCEKMVNEARPK